MAITLDGTNTQGSDETGSASTLTVARTTSAGSNTGIVAQVVCYGTNRATTGVTFNSAALTKLNQSDANNVNTSLWFKPTPSVGTFNMVVTQPGNCSGISVACIALFGVQQGTTPDAHFESGGFLGASSPITESITTIAASCWIFDAIGDQSAALTKGAAQTLSLDQFGHTGTGSYKTDVSAGANTMTWTFSGSESGVYVLASLAPAAAASTYRPNNFQLLGVS